jgi:hypothetical protein
MPHANTGYASGNSTLPGIGRRGGVVVNALLREDNYYTMDWK